MMPLFVQRTMRLLMVYLMMQRLLRECYCYIYCPNMRQFVTPDLQINIAKVLSRCLENVELCMNGIKIPRETSCKVPEFNNTSDIDVDWFTCNNYQYKFNFGIATISETTKFCRNEGGALASTGIRNQETRRQIFSSRLFNQLRTKLSNPDSALGVWIGLQRNTTEPRQWWWADGVLGNNSNIGWAVGEPADSTLETYAFINKNRTAHPASQFVLYFGLCEKSLEAD